MSGDFDAVFKAYQDFFKSHYSAISQLHPSGFVGHHQQSKTRGTQVTTNSKKPTAAQLIKQLEEKVDNLKAELEGLDEQVQSLEEPEGMTPDEVREIVQEELPDMDEYALKEDLPDMDEVVTNDDLDQAVDAVFENKLAEHMKMLLEGDGEVELGLENGIRDILHRENKLTAYLKTIAADVFDEKITDTSLDNAEILKLLKDPTSAISTAIRDKIVTAVNAAKLGDGARVVDKAEIEGIKSLLSAHASSLGNEIAERQNLKRYTDSLIAVNRENTSQRMDRIDTNMTAIKKDLAAGIEVLSKTIGDLKKAEAGGNSAEIAKLRADLDLENKNRIRQVDARVSEATDHIATLRKDVDRYFREDRTKLDRHSAEIDAVSATARDASRDAKAAITHANGAVNKSLEAVNEVTGLKRTATTLSDAQKVQQRLLADISHRQDAHYSELFLKAELLRETLLQQIDAHNNNMKVINAFMKEHQAKFEQAQVESKPVEMSLKSEASTAGYRIAVRQVTKLVHEPMVARFCQMDPANASIIKLLASSELGRAALAATMSVGVDYAGQKMTGQYAIVAGNFARELRVSAMSDTADFALDIVMEPLRDVICKAITDRHTGISTEVLDAPVVQEVVMVEQQAQACAG